MRAKRTNMPNFSKLSISALLTGVVIMLATVMGISAAVIFIQLYQNSTEQNVITSSEQSVVQVGNTVENYLDDMKKIMEKINRNISKDAAEQQIFFQELVKIRSDLESVMIYDKNYQLINSWAEAELKEQFKDSGILDENRHRGDDIMISRPHVETGFVEYYPWVVTIYQRLKNAENEDVYAFMNISFDSIADYIDDVGIGQHGYCFLMDDGGNIIYHPQQQLIYSGLKEMRQQDMLELADSDDGSHVKADLIYTVRSIDDSNWKIVGVSYIDEMVTKKVEKMQRVSYVLVYLVLLAAIVIGFFFTRIFSKPVNSLVKAIKKFEKNAQTYNYEPIGGTKEIVALSDSFAHMVIRIQRLMEKVRLEEVTLRKTELKALQAQINPHFLYNTLDSIAWMCEEGRMDAAVDMVNSLARLFRISISRGQELIPLERELQHAKSYLHIQSFRYKNQFIYTFDVDEQCLKYYCNKITLQPLIENAIYHGLGCMIDQGEIYIGIHEEEDAIILEVRDNGVGMEEETCREILLTDNTGNTGIGIKNVNDRIKIYFGAEYGLSIESELDVGTRVIVKIPKILEGEYDAK